MNRLFFTVIIAVCNLHAYSQKLSVGNTLPITKFKNVLNYNGQEIDLLNLKNKLVILDFWGPTCTSCLKMFPKLDSLQKRMQDKIQIILVNKQGKTYTKHFFEQHKKITLPAVPLITSDTLLYSYFPHIGEPFQVWINPDRSIAYITSGQHTNEETVNVFLSTGKLPVFVDHERTRVKSLFDEQYADHVKYYSYISTCINLSTLDLVPGNKDYIISTRKCKSIIELYEMAYNESLEYYYKFERPGRLQFIGTDSSKYFRPSDPEQFHEWVQSNGYYYQLSVVESKAKEKYHIMQEDLDRYFDLDAKVIKKKVKCLVLTAKNGYAKLESKGGVQRDNFFQTEMLSAKFDSVRYYYNKPYGQFSKQMAYYVEQTLSIPFVDSVNYHGNIDIAISGTALDSMNITLLNKELNNYGLALEQKEVILDVLSIKQRGN